MATVVCTIKIMPEGPDSNLDAIRSSALSKISNYAGEQECKVDIEPIAFGLKALMIIFVVEEDKGSTEPLEKELATLEGVSSAEIVDVRRAIG